MLYTYYSGSADIIGNNIGDTTTTESIVINTLSSSTTNAIAIRTIEASNIQNNIIGSIKLVGDVAIANNFNGIYISPNTSSTLLINGNYIGSYSTADNIICSASATSSPTGQTMRGIYSQSQGSTTISNNTIAGITNNYSGTYNTNTLAGIYVDRGTNTIQNNVVKKLKTASGNTGNFGLASIYGIGISNTNNGVTQLVSGNEVSHIYNTNNNQSVVLSGLFFEGADDVFHQISGNYIHTLELSTSNISSKTMGVCLYRGKANFYNNIIHLGKDYTNMHYMYGMWDNAYSLASLNMYFNTLFIDGTSAEGSINSTYALWNQTNSGTARNLKNNIITNLRSGGTDGSHYSIRIANTTDMTIDYNNYYVSDGMLAAFGNTNITTIEDWKVVTAQDVNSYNGNPDFMNTGSGYEKLYPTFPCNGLAGLGIENDYTGQTRSSTLPKLGALEINESVWTGTIDTDFATAGNWEDGFVPTPGTNLRFTPTPSNHCVLDANRTVGNIVNPSNKDLVLNAHKLTIVGNTFFSSTGLIDGLVANSSIEFAGDDAQTFEANIIKDSIIDYLIINNSNNVTLDGNITINEELNLSIGDFSIGDNILELNGLISTTSGSMTGGILSTIIFGGAGATTSLPAISLSTLEVNRASGISFSGNVVLADTLKLTNGTLDIAGYNFDLGIDTIMITTGNIDASTINTTLQFTNTDTLYLPNSVFAGGGNVVYNLMIDDYGLYSETDISITNQLYLNSNNPTATRGLLDMRTTKVLTMQASATTVGQGDVTGRILRNSISANTVYTFGSEYNKLIFTDGTGAELPSEILFITVIGESHPIKTNSINRYHQIIRTGGTAPTRFGLTLRYLDSELNNNDENNLVYWDHHVPYAGTSPHEHGKSSQDFVNKTLTLSSHGIGYLAPEEYAGKVVYVDDITTPPNKSKIWLISNKESVADYEWIGAESSDWTNVANWSGGAVPDATSEV